MSLETMSISEVLTAVERGDWSLHPAQRSSEWNLLRVTNLVDSLLRGFPIGTVLLAAADGRSYRLGDESHGRELQSGVELQILDGQQRCLALRASFGGHGMVDDDARKFLWINVGGENQKRREFDSKRSQRYLFAWSAQDDLNAADADFKKEKLPRENPGGWVKFCELTSRAMDKPVESVRAELDLRIETDILDSLLPDISAAFCEPRLPVHTLANSSVDAADLHEVFIRLNAGGVPLSAADQFFAGVKRYWPTAEADLSELTNTNSRYHRHGGIRILARTAGVSLAERPIDLLNLRLRDLASRSDTLVAAMRELVQDGSALVTAVHAITDEARRCLGDAADLIDANYFDAGVAWYYERLLTNQSPTETELAAVSRFIFWSSVSSVFAHGQARARREYFKWGREAGQAGELFPIERIFRDALGYVRVQEKLPAERVDFCVDSQDRRRANICMTQKRGEFLSVFQGIDSGATNLDVDHVYPQALALRRSRGRESGDQFRYWVNQIGNLAFLDSSANRSAQDKAPSIKLANLDTAVLGYVADELALLADIEEFAESKDIVRAAPLMKRLALVRAGRIWSEVVEQVGEPPLAELRLS